MRAAPDEAPFSDDEIQAIFADVELPEGGGDGTLVAVSGGSDSLGLLLLLKRWRELRRSAQAIVTATVDHGLRDGSAAEAGEVSALCERWGFEHVTLRWRGAKPMTGVQEAAREARYELLAAEAGRRVFGHLVTAHTRDDQAETLLMRLARGSGLKGLSGIRPWSRRLGLALHRPLLDVSRARLRAALTAAGVGWIDDPSNADTRFLRPRLRELMPRLAGEGLDAVRLADVARKLRRADEAIEHGVRGFLIRHCSLEYRKRTAAKRSVRCPLLPIHLLQAEPWLQRGGPQEGITWHVAIDAEPFRAEPTEVAMRILAQAIRHVVQGEPVADRPLEDLTVEALQHRHAPVRRTLGGALISVGAKVIRISPEPPRRGQRPS